LFQEDAYISIDFLEKESQIITLTDQNTKGAMMPIDTYKGKRYLSMESPRIEHNNAIVDELNDFYRSIIDNTLPKVTIEDGYRALALASRIEAVIAEQPHL
jgi:predicted dehydrogenase